MRNKYFLIIPDKPPIEVFAEHSSDNPNLSEYFFHVFQHLEGDYDLTAFTVFFVWSPKTKLPRVGNDVIVVVYGETCLVPAYAGHVAAVFKCFGLRPTLIPRRRPLRLAQIELFEFIRSFTRWLPSGLRWVISRKVQQRCHTMPLGYALHGGVEGLPFDQRSLLVSFSGSVAKPAAHQWLRRLIGTPKSYCRGRLIEVLTQLEQSLGEQVTYCMTGGFHQSLELGGRNYFNVLARTKICVAPRGTAHESYRIYEGLRLGCIVISDRLPERSFYKDSPIIQIDDWAQLPDVLERLLNDPRELRNLHRRSLEFWHSQLSESAFAKRCAVILGLKRRVSSQDYAPETREMTCGSF